MDATVARRRPAPAWAYRRAGGITPGSSIRITMEPRNSYTKRHWYYVEHLGLEVAGPFPSCHAAVRAAWTYQHENGLARKRVYPPKQRKDYPGYHHVEIVELEEVPMNGAMPLTYIGNVVITNQHGARSFWPYTYQPALDLLRAWTPDGVEINEAHKHGPLIKELRKGYPYRKAWA
jgi:hypothetical protein